MSSIKIMSLFVPMEIFAKNATTKWNRCTLCKNTKQGSAQTILRMLIVASMGFTAH